MKKIAVVFGVAAVATFTGCKDPDYAGRRAIEPQGEPKSIETTPTEVTPTEVTPVEVKTVETTPAEVTPQTQTPVATKPTEPAYTIYIVQNGDYLSKISKKYNVTIKSIKELNGLKTDTIRVGQKLKLPGNVDVGVQTAPAAVCTMGSKASKKGYTPYTGATKEYVVKNGDTLGAVAYGNGLNIRQLKELNKLTSDTLKVGQKLKIPAEKVVKAEPAKQAAVEAKKAEIEVKKAEVEVKKAEVEAKEAAVEVKEAEIEVKKAEAEAKEAEATLATTTYVVEEGDSLTRLAVDFGVTPAVIRDLNNLGENDAIKPGQVLKLPAETQP